MDPADAWLREHDPDYTKSRQTWKNLDDDGQYAQPTQEALVGLPTGILDLAGDRACQLCGGLFTPRQKNHRFCSELHRKRAQMRDLRKRWRSS